MISRLIDRRWPALVGVLVAASACKKEEPLFECIDCACTVGSWLQVSPMPEPVADAAMVKTSDGLVLLAPSSEGQPMRVWRWDGLSWSDDTLGSVQDNTAPASVQEHAAAYDDTRDQVVTCGGTTGGAEPQPSDTWGWRSSPGWEQIAGPGQGPEARTAPSMTTLPSGDVLLFGGLQVPDVLSNDRWTWNGTTWTRVIDAGSPPGRWQHAIATDAARGAAVLFAGNASSDASPALLRDTWTFAEDTWQLRPVQPAPPARAAHTLVYDPSVESTVLFGGSDGTEKLNDVWTWDGSGWSEARILGTEPAGRSGHVAAYDNDSGGMVVAGGTVGQDDAPSDQTWLFRWVEADAAAGFCCGDGVCQLPERERQSCPQDCASSCVVGEWEQIMPALRPESIASPFMVTTEDAVLLMAQGETAPQQVWRWDGQNWTNLTTGTPMQDTAPSAMSGAAAAYMPTTAEVVFYGGFDLVGGEFQFLVETWLWDGAGWSMEAGEPEGAGVRLGLSMAFDPDSGVPILFGGFGNEANFQSLGGTWSWDGTSWTDLQITGPSERFLSPMVADTTRREVILFGGITSTMDSSAIGNDTWIFRDGGWLEANPETSPSARAAHSLVHDPGLEMSVLFGGRGDDGDVSDVWAWDGAEWSQVFVPGASPEPRAFHAAAYDPANEAMLMVGGANAIGVNAVALDETWFLRVTNELASSGACCGDGVCQATEASSDVCPEDC